MEDQVHGHERTQLILHDLFSCMQTQELLMPSIRQVVQKQQLIFFFRVNYDPTGPYLILS